MIPEIVSVVLASVPASMFTMNVFLFRPAPRGGDVDETVSVLIPARNEEEGIGEALRCVLANTGVRFEVIVADDGSTDRTAEIVREFAATDRRVRLVSGVDLPPGWCGKQHACFQLSRHAANEIFCFLDADVRLRPDALRRMVYFLHSSRSELVSGFPRQVTIGWAERLLIPLIHFVLLGFLPFAGMRRSVDPAFAAGCGQLMMTRRKAYARTGGHSAVRATLHDGLRLPRAFRSAGYRTDVFDASDIARCRMYSSARDVWSGLAKNAVEGMAAPGRLPWFTILLAGGQIVPAVLLFAGLWNPSPALWLSAVALGLAYYPRVVSAVRYRESVASALLHPVGVAVLLVLQWYALVRHLAGRPSAWRGRSYVLPDANDTSA